MTVYFAVVIFGGIILALFMYLIKIINEETKEEEKKAVLLIHLVKSISEEKQKTNPVTEKTLEET